MTEGYETIHEEENKIITEELDSSLVTEEVTTEKDQYTSEYSYHLRGEAGGFALRLEKAGFSLNRTPSVNQVIEHHVEPIKEEPDEIASD